MLTTTPPSLFPSAIQPPQLTLEVEKTTFCLGEVEEVPQIKYVQVQPICKIVVDASKFALTLVDLRRLRGGRHALWSENLRLVE